MSWNWYVLELVCNPSVMLWMWHALEEVCPPDDVPLSGLSLDQRVLRIGVYNKRYAALRVH